MAVVAGQNGNGVDVRVVEDFFVVAGGVLEAKLFARDLGVQSACRGDTNQGDATRFFDGRKQNARGKVTRADYTQFDI